MNPPKSGLTLLCQRLDLEPQVRPLYPAKAKQRVPRPTPGLLLKACVLFRGERWCKAGLKVIAARNFGVWAGPRSTSSSAEALRITFPSQVFLCSVYGLQSHFLIVHRCAGWKQARLSHAAPTCDMYLILCCGITLLLVPHMLLSSSLIAISPVFLSFQGFFLIRLWLFLDFIMETAMSNLNVSSAYSQVLHLPKVNLSFFISSWKKRKLFNCIY